MPAALIASRRSKEFRAVDPTASACTRNKSSSGAEPRRFRLIELRCSRCLEPLERHLEIAFDDVFVDASEEPTVTETEVAETELDESLVIGGSVDMSEVVREQILLAMPEQVYCKDDCKGLCPKCGGNRNLTDCSCADDETDPRWAALKDLK